MYPNQHHIYEALRERNPWLPPGDFVSGKPGFSIQMGLDKIPTMNLEVFIEIPDMLINNRVHDFYEKVRPEDRPPEGQDRPKPVVSEARPSKEAPEESQEEQEAS